LPIFRDFDDGLRGWMGVIGIRRDSWGTQFSTDSRNQRIETVEKWAFRADRRSDLSSQCHAMMVKMVCIRPLEIGPNTYVWTCIRFRIASDRPLTKRYKLRLRRVEYGYAQTLLIGYRGTVDKGVSTRVG
jgi:hypothetical protein